MRRKSHTFSNKMSSIISQIDSVDMAISDSCDTSKRHHFEPQSKTFMSLKRKCNCDEVLLSEQIKRFRITSTPGELRLQKDLKELEAMCLSGISLQYPDDTGGVIVHYSDNIPFAPETFRISVPRYYPHNHPIVFRVGRGFPCPFILPTGELIHPSLREEWSAIGTLRTVIEVIQSVRLLFHNSFQVEYSSGGSCLDSLSGEMNEIKDSNEICMGEIVLIDEKS